jgi:periplasmic divalent cation tolerance protein
MDVLMVEITAGSVEEAERIGRTLVEERLAACANLLPGLRSVYRWKGRVEEASEALLLAKTTAAALPALVERARALHSYECPCIAAWSIQGGNPDYLAWIEAECAAPPVSRHGSHAVRGRGRRLKG